MNRRDFLQSGAGVIAASASAGASPMASAEAQTAGPDAAAPQTRDAWIARLTQMATPVLTNLAQGTLKTQMPCEAAAGSEAARRKFTHLEAFGRLLAGMAPWLELPADDSAEGRTRATFVD